MRRKEGRGGRSDGKKGGMGRDEESEKIKKLSVVVIVVEAPSHMSRRRDSTDFLREKAASPLTDMLVSIVVVVVDVLFAVVVVVVVVAGCRYCC